MSEGHFTMRMWVEDWGENNPARVIIEKLITIDQDIAEQLAEEALRKYYEVPDFHEVIWLETAEGHPDDFLGMDEKETGVWL